MDQIDTERQADRADAARGIGRWAGVVDLMLRRSEMVNDSGLSSLRAYWEALRGDALVPRRSEVDPRGIERALGIAFLAERVAPEVARFRVAGMRINGLMGMEVRGMPLSAMFQPDGRETLGRALRRVFDGPAIAEVSLRGATGFMQPRLDGRMLLLPLRAEDGTVSRILGGLAVTGSIGTTPRRLEVTGLRILPLTVPAETDTMGLAATDGRVSGLAEDPAAFVPAPPQHRGRPQLRVVRSDD
ncbi:MAG: PAS domain-containing protein [Alkalilacustris sp.]